MVYRFVLIGLIMVAPIVSHGQVSYSLGNEAAYIARMEREVAQSDDDSVRAYTSLKLSLLYKRANDTTQARRFLEKGAAAGKRYTFIGAASVYYRAIFLYAPRDLNNLERYILKSDSLLMRFSYPEAYRIRSMIYSNYGIIQQVKGNEKGAMDAFRRHGCLYNGRNICFESRRSSLAR
jgi:two-component system, NarL family, sensor kinase